MIKFKQFDKRSVCYLPDLWARKHHHGDIEQFGQQPAVGRSRALAESHALLF